MNLRRLDRLSVPAVRYEFVVSGAGTFPFDMLSHDRAYPANIEEASKLNEYGPERRYVKLVSASSVREWTPHQAGWKTFGWRVE